MSLVRKTIQSQTTSSDRSGKQWLKRGHVDAPRRKSASQFPHVTTTFRDLRAAATEHMLPFTRECWPQRRHITEVQGGVNLLFLSSYHSNSLAQTKQQTSSMLTELFITKSHLLDQIVSCGSLKTLLFKCGHTKPSRPFLRTFPLGAFPAPTVP